MKQKHSGRANGMINKINHKCCAITFCYLLPEDYRKSVYGHWVTVRRLRSNK